MCSLQQQCLHLRWELHPGQWAAQVGVLLAEDRQVRGEMGNHQCASVLRMIRQKVQYALYMPVCTYSTVHKYME